MSENEELDPALLRHLRDVPPASDSVRDAHIAAALAELAPPRSSLTGRTRILGGIAAAVMLTLGGVTIARQQVDSGRGPLNAAFTTTVPKGSADCAEEFSGLRAEAGDSKEFEHNGNTYVAMFRDDAIDVYAATEPCNLVGTLDYREAMVTRDNASSPTDTPAVCSYATEPIAAFDDMANGDTHRLDLVHAAEGLNLYFADACDEPIATLALP